MKNYIIASMVAILSTTQVFAADSLAPIRKKKLPAIKKVQEEPPSLKKQRQYIDEKGRFSAVQLTQAEILEGKYANHGQVAFDLTTGHPATASRHPANAKIIKELEKIYKPSLWGNLEEIPKYVVELKDRDLFPFPVELTLDQVLAQEAHRIRQTENPSHAIEKLRKAKNKGLLSRYFSRACHQAIWNCPALTATTSLMNFWRLPTDGYHEFLDIDDKENPIPETISIMADLELKLFEDTCHTLLADTYSLSDTEKDNALKEAKENVKETAQFITFSIIAIAAEKPLAPASPIWTKDVDQLTAKHFYNDIHSVSDARKLWEGGDFAYFNLGSQIRVERRHVFAEGYSASTMFQRRLAKLLLDRKDQWQIGNTYFLSEKNFSTAGPVKFIVKISGMGMGTNSMSQRDLRELAFKKYQSNKAYNKFKEWVENDLKSNLRIFNF